MSWTSWIPGRGEAARVVKAARAIPPPVYHGPLEMTAPEFLALRDLIKERCGIDLGANKQTLVKARLGSRIRELGVSSFTGYMQLVERDESEGELTRLLDAISTNVTSFFRQAEHFDYLAEELVPRVATRTGATPRRLRIWSAGCSSGEEPYSIVIALREAIADFAPWDVKVLATDISTRMLAHAREGIYEASRMEDMPQGLRVRYMEQVEPAKDRRRFRVDPRVRETVSFARLNLMGAWPMKGPFDAIFCRNVMIYFDRPSQAKLIRRFRDLLGQGGTLFIGHSETLSGINEGLAMVSPTIYAREGEGR